MFVRETGGRGGGGAGGKLDASVVSAVEFCDPLHPKSNFARANKTLLAHVC